MKSLVAIFIASALVASGAGAQDEAAGRARAIEAATALANSGQLYAARRITDSLARITPSDAADLKDLLFARATFAPSVLDASLDYEKIVSEMPASATSKASLLRLAQRALVASELVKSLDYLQRILRDYPDDASVAEAQYWRARVLLDSHDVPAACSANQEALSHGRASHSPLLALIEAQGFVSCGQAPVVQAVLQPPVTTKPLPTPKPIASSGKHYAVQVSAYALKSDADAMATRLKGKGFDAHVDGDAKPFRVRIGRYATYAEAAKALRELKTKGLSGFVSETNQ